MILSSLKRLAINGVELSRLEVNGVEVWSGGYTNLVPTAADADGNAYQGKGYIDGYRLSSGGDLTLQANTATTGFIRCRATDVIRMGGLTFRPTSGHCYLSFYDSGFRLLGSVNIYKDSSSPTGWKNIPRGIVRTIDATSNTPPTETDGVTTFDHYYFSDGLDVAYFRVNGYGGSGAEMIVTVNEEID